MELNEIIANHEKETTNQIAIATIESFNPYETLFQYSVDLGNYWGVDQKDTQIQIQVGYGLEDKLEDDEAKRIIDNAIVPEFKNGDYFQEIKKDLHEIIKEIKYVL